MEARIEQWLGRPAAPLRPFVHRYTWHRYRELAPGFHQGLPSRHLRLMISLDDPFEIVDMPGPQSAGRFTAFLGGLHTKPATIAHPGYGRGVGIDLTPAGARALARMPAAALAATVVDLGEIFGRCADELIDRLATATTWPERVRIVDRALIAVLSDPTGPTRPRPVVTAAWEHLVTAGGTTRIGALASDLGISRRHLSELFRAEYGLSPKRAARVLRFERASTLLQQPARPSLAAVAATCGYFDQAHLCEEWSALAGMPPWVWLARQLRDLSLEAV